MVLTGARFDVHAVETGTEGLNAAGLVNPVLITLDVGLSDLSGLEVAQRLRQVTKATILMITAFAADTDQLNGMAPNAEAYLIKPFRPAQLRALVQEPCPEPLSQGAAADGKVMGSPGAG